MSESEREQEQEERKRETERARGSEIVITNVGGRKHWLDNWEQTSFLDCCGLIQESDCCGLIQENL